MGRANVLIIMVESEGFVAGWSNSNPAAVCPRRGWVGEVHKRPSSRDESPTLTRLETRTIRIARVDWSRLHWHDESTDPGFKCPTVTHRSSRRDCPFFFSTNLPSLSHS